MNGSAEMPQIIQWLVEKFWKKWSSIPAFILVLVLILVSIIPEEWRVNNPKAIAFYIVVSLCFFLIIWYIAICIKENRLPKAKALSVLFVIDTESDQLFRDVEKKLVSNFDDCFWGNDKNRFSSICIQLSDLEKYDLHKEADQIEILQRTNCAFFVKVRYHVDNIKNIENYDMNIIYGIVHPTLKDQAQEILQFEMDALGRPITKRRFNKNQLIDTLDFTAQALSLICQYLYALICLFSAKTQRAYDILHNMRGEMQQGHSAYRTYNIGGLINLRLYQACMILEREQCEAFYHERSIKALEKSNDLLEEANKIFPQSYEYYLDKAYYCVAHDLDGKNAKAYICECRKMNKDGKWKYSEAFLAAFFHQSSNTILKKYNLAFRVDEDLPRIADYIEYILEIDPSKTDLHFAAGLVYDRINDGILAKEHFEQYLKTSNGKKAEQFIRSKLNTYRNQDHSFD